MPSKVGWTALSFLLLLSAAAGLAASDPADLNIQFRSSNPFNRFQVGEVIQVEVLMSSTTPNRYLEPCSLFRESHFGFPQCRFSSQWSFAITPEGGWVDYTKEFGGPQTFGGPTIEVPVRYLATNPTVSTYILTNRFRFDRPGEYKVHLSVDVGFDDEASRSQAKPHSLTLTREIALQIVPAQEDWQKEIVRKGHEAYSMQPPQETNPPSQALLDYQEAKLALCTVGTPEAAQVLAKAISPSNYYDVLRCLERSPGVSAGVEELQQLLIDPDVGVTPGLFSTLVGLLNLQQSKLVGGIFLAQDTVDKEREALFAALPQKRGEAQVISLATVLQFPPRSQLNPNGEAYDLPFPAPVIEVAAENFERLPHETQMMLLERGWDRIRSPQMLAAVRRRAEVGDGPAVLRWLELDPAAATQFIRKEIVRPQPRFSSYYLRLPDATLPGEEAKIAANFAAFANLNDDHDLVHSASLLHRYATAAVLPTVLPLIDAKLTDWSCSIQVPALAYLLKVSPDVARPRVVRVLESTQRNQACTSRVLTTLGLLQPSPVLARLAMDEIETGGPSAADGAYYLLKHAPAEWKSKIWKQFEIWRKRVNASGAEQRVRNGKGAPGDFANYDLIQGLTEAYEKAQAWVLTPEDEKNLRKLLHEETSNQLACSFSCGASLSVGPGPAEYAVYGRANEGRDNEQESMEYLNSPERLNYSVKQYHCDDTKQLEEKVLQFPTGSTFVFAYDFTARDEKELREISNFLRGHGYKVKNVQN